MFINFKDINGSDITLDRKAIWGITIPAESIDPDVPSAPGEVLLEGANRSVKVGRELAKEIKESCDPFVITANA